MAPKKKSSSPQSLYSAKVEKAYTSSHSSS